MSGILLTTSAAAGAGAVALAAVAMFGLRKRWWPHTVAFAMFVVAALAGAHGAVAAIVGWTRAATAVSPAEVALGGIGLVLGLAVAAPVASFACKLFTSPSLTDISTDTDDPPKLESAAASRPPGSHTVEYGGEECAALQHHAYPNVAPGKLDVQPATAFERAVGVARELGWALVSVRPDVGIFEAEARTPVLKLTDDVAVRVRPDGSGARIDVRSASRVGATDVGANARRVETFLAKLTGVTARAGRP